VLPFANGRFLGFPEDEPKLIGLPRNSKTVAMTLSPILPKDRGSRFSSCALIARLNFTIYGRMIPLIVALLFALDVFSSAFFRPNLPARGVGKSIESSVTLHRAHFEPGSSALLLAMALFNARCKAADLRQGLQNGILTFLVIRFY
jgi:hypothetical protein